MWARCGAGARLRVYDGAEGERRFGVTEAALRGLAGLGRAGGMEKD